MLELNGVHTHYGLSHVLQGIDLKVGQGEVVCLFGRNGVGKTTVIKTIAGWVSPSSGEVIFNGEPLNGVGADQICRRGIGLVPEDRRIFPGLTVEENLHLGQMQCPSRSRLDARRRMEEIYQRFPRLVSVGVRWGPPCRAANNRCSLLRGCSLVSQSCCSSMSPRRVWRP